MYEPRITSGVSRLCCCVPWYTCDVCPAQFLPFVGRFYTKSMLYASLCLRLYHRWITTGFSRLCCYVPCHTRNVYPASTVSSLCRFYTSALRLTLSQIVSPMDHVRCVTSLLMCPLLHVWRTSSTVSSLCLPISHKCSKSHSVSRLYHWWITSGVQRLRCCVPWYTCDVYRTQLLNSLSMSIPHKCSKP